MECLAPNDLMGPAQEELDLGIFRMSAVNSTIFDKIENVEEGDHGTRF